MPDELNAKPDPGEPMVYQIRIKGHLSGRWTDWFGGLKVTLEDNEETLFTGPVIDQAALHGLLRKVRDLGMPLLSVNRIKPGQADTAEVQRQIEDSCVELSPQQTNQVNLTPVQKESYDKSQY